MPSIDYMAVIDLLAKTLRQEHVDVRFPDKSVDRIEAVMSSPDAPPRSFIVTVQADRLEISFPKNYYSDREIDAWLPSFEYELEQKFLRNVEVSMEKDISRHIVKIKM